LQSPLLTYGTSTSCARDGYALPDVAVLPQPITVSMRPERLREPSSSAMRVADEGAEDASVR
jgi:hypothetical protein